MPRLESDAVQSGRKKGDERSSAGYLLELDGMELPMAIRPSMIAACALALAGRDFTTMGRKWAAR